MLVTVTETTRVPSAVHVLIWSSQEVPRVPSEGQREDSGQGHRAGKWPGQNLSPSPSDCKDCLVQHQAQRPVPIGPLVPGACTEHVLDAYTEPVLILVLQGCDLGHVILGF